MLTIPAGIGLKMNVSKTKVFSSHIQEAGKMPIIINSPPVEE